MVKDSCEVTKNLLKYSCYYFWVLCLYECDLVDTIKCNNIDQQLYYLKKTHSTLYFLGILVYKIILFLMKLGLIVSVNKILVYIVSFNNSL